MPVTTQAADTAGSSKGITALNISNPLSSGRKTRIITTVKLSGPQPRPPIRRSSRSGSSVFSTKNLTAAVNMVSAKQDPLDIVTPPARPSHRKTQSQHRISKPSGSIGSRKVFAKIGGMEPPVQSFYGAEPIALPTRFANIKRRLIQGKEEAIEASWRRLLVALKDEIAHIHDRGTDLIPTIDFSDINDPAKVADFERHLKRYGVAVVRGVVSQTQTKTWISQTRQYITRNRDHIKPPVPQDPTCFDLFWTPAQCAIRAHPAVLRVQKWAMAFWETRAIDADISRVATRFPISYADRLRIHDGSILGANAAAPPQVNGNSAADSLTASAASTLIAQVDNGSLERWEPDGYGRGGAYEAVFRGEWEDFDPWDPSGRINVTQDLYNGAGSCSIFRMFQGVLALTSGEPASIRVLPSPKLVAAYFLLRPFFSSKTTPPSSGYDEDGASAETLAEWAAFLDPDNWALDSEQSTIIHGAVPGHAQRITELWHPHLRLRRSLVEIPTLQAGDYVIWHCDEAYSIMTTAESKPGTPGPDTPAPSMLIYTPACPLTQTNALFLARQRKAFLQGQPGPDFDSAGGSTMGSEAPHEGRPGMEEIAAVGGDAGLRAMGLAPWELSPDGSRVMTTPATRAGSPAPAESAGSDKTVVAGEGSGTVEKKWSTEGEAEVVRLANIILFPDRYDFYIPTEKAGSAKERINGKAQAEQMAATRQLISRILT
ncbi:hypothetical protein VMCG_06773 [Cytospora schulzeri]|uniref:DUF1479 domain protein n=1 Tax=Cytospora schulzeri TaxID=448051 RepID=A0A423W5U2_9PEZI|nr:hypothetical protein VMCG_06773 [Valsa malicola]